MPTYLPCRLCITGRATHRAATACQIWLCDQCDPLTADRQRCRSALAVRMADGLVIEARLNSLNLRDFGACCEALHSYRFYGIDIVEGAETAMNAARQRIADGELSSYQPIVPYQQLRQSALWGFG